MTKIILIAFAIAFVPVAIQGASVPAELQEAAKAARAACIEETGATEDMIEKTSIGEFPDDEKLKCYSKCIFNKFTLIDNDKINIDAMLEMLPAEIKEKGTKIIENCRETTGTDLCDQSYNLTKCMYQQSPEDFIVI